MKGIRNCEIDSFWTFINAFELLSKFVLKLCLMPDIKDGLKWLFQILLWFWILNFLSCPKWAKWTIFGPQIYIFMRIPLDFLKLYLMTVIKVGKWESFGCVKKIFIIPKWGNWFIFALKIVDIVKLGKSSMFSWNYVMLEGRHWLKVSESDCFRFLRKIVIKCKMGQMGQVLELGSHFCFALNFFESS